MRQLISSGSPYEPVLGFSRAVRAGDRIEVSGTAPVRNGQTAGEGDIYEQTRTCLEIIIQAVKDAGGRPENIVRTRVMMTDISRWQEAGRAHGELLGEIRPATTFVEVKGFIDPRWLVEIEASAQITG